MCDNNTSDILESSTINKTVIHPLIPNNLNGELEAAQEAATTDSEEYLSESLR